MDQFKTQFKFHVATTPESTAINTKENIISYSELDNQINNVKKQLAEHESQRVAIALPNSPAWIAADLATVFADIPCTPIPHFFSSTQVSHLIEDAGIDTILIDRQHLSDVKFQNLRHLARQTMQVFGQNYELLKIESANPKNTLPAKTLKVSYTSGTTGQPKGVMIRSGVVDKVVSSLKQILNATSRDKHISVLPFSLLLENIAGIYTVLAAGGQCLLPDFSELGLDGSSSFDAQKFTRTLIKYQPTTMITVPALAQALISTSEKLNIAFDSFRYIAVGGAPISHCMIRKAHVLGLPLYEGYGLTECSSVVALNTQTEHKPGSVGRPLPHVEIEISDEGEILVGGASSAGYIHEPENQESSKWATGDLGHIDEEGFLFITGRKRTSYCTAFGRNVAPEWIERELVAQPQIDQALLYGEGKPFNLAIIVANKFTDDDELGHIIDSLNHCFPDYARVGCWIRANEPFSTEKQQLSPGGILMRQKILMDYQADIERIYQ